MLKFLHWLRNRRARQEKEAFWQWLNAYEELQRDLQSQQLPCPCCGKSNPKGSNFCSGCGLNLQPDQKEQNTEPHRLNERPFLAYVHQQHTDPGPHTTKHRTVRLKPLQENNRG